MTYAFPMTDIGKFLEVEHEKDNLYIYFNVWNTSLSIPIFFLDCMSDTPEFYEEKEKAKPYITGSLKWDGCINYSYTENWEKHCMLHKCGLKSFELELLVFKKLYDECKKIIKGNIL